MKMKEMLVRVSVVAMLALMLSVSAFAEDETSAAAGADAIANQLVSGLQTMVPTILTAIGAIAVAGLTIFGAKFAVTAGLAMFKKVTGRS